MEAEERVQTGQLRVVRKHPTKLIKQSVDGEVKLHREHGECRETEKQKRCKMIRETYKERVKKVDQTDKVRGRSEEASKEGNKPHTD